MNTDKAIANIPEIDKKRVVVIGGGFAGLRLLRKLRGKGFQIVLLDKNNFHQFQPRLYQVATAGLEPSAISFPLRKVLQKEKDIHFRIAELQVINHEEKEVTTDIGTLKYDYLVLATGTQTNFFGQENIEKHALSMKTAADSILIRNTILENFEAALSETNPDDLGKYMNVAIVGGGPTGAELAGALAEMKKYIFPKDYPELDLSHMRIVLFEASDRLLSGMSDSSGELAKNYLTKLGVEVFLNSRVQDFDGETITLSDDQQFISKTLIWAAGVKSKGIVGLNENCLASGGRILVDRFNQVNGLNNIFALGDLALMKTPKYPDGHPQLAQPAIQSATLLASNLVKMGIGQPLKEFEYKDKGSMATIGRNLAVADLPGVKLKGFLAWALWLFVHLMSIVGVKNRLLVFVNWMWNYFTYDHSLRLLIKPKMKVSTKPIE